MKKVATIDLAFQFLLENKKDASFEDIWNAISKDIDGDNEHKNEIIAELYSDLVLDNRFALTSDGKWGLRDYLKFDDVKKQYDYVDKFETTEEFDDLEEILDDLDEEDDDDEEDEEDEDTLDITLDDDDESYDD